MGRSQALAPVAGDLAHGGLTVDHENGPAHQAKRGGMLNFGGLYLYGNWVPPGAGLLR